MSVKKIREALRKCANSARAEGARRYFKEPADDIFIGVTMPQCRDIAKSYRDLPTADVSLLLKSPYHEERSVAQMILVERFRKGDARTKKQVYDLLMKMRRTLNSWDAVDATAPSIVGPYLHDKNKAVLYKLARSKSLWDRRIAIVATSYFIRKHQLEDTFRIAEMLLSDKEDLIHKATGWMLREAGKKDQPALEQFLKTHYHSLPRTSLRYAIERFPENKRKAFLAGNF